MATQEEMINAIVLDALKAALEAMCWHDAEDFEDENGRKAGDVVRAAILLAEGE